jgi:signal peptidase I
VVQVNTQENIPVDKSESSKSGSAEQKQPSSRRLRSAFATVGILLLAPLIAIILTTFVFQSYQVDGQSMQNTLQNNDRLIVWKLPRTWAKITGHQYVPKRGDIVIATESGLLSHGDSVDTKQIVKRVIGLPGERVVYKNGAYTVYNATYPKGFDPDTTLAYGKSNTALLNDPTGTTVDITLNDHQLFISGDHRANSLDSRYFGPVNTNQIIGTLAVRILPLSQIKRF